MLYAAVGLIWLDALLGLDEMMKEEYQRFMFFSASALLLIVFFKKDHSLSLCLSLAHTNMHIYW